MEFTKLILLLIAVLTLSACGMHYKSDGAIDTWQTPRRTRELGTFDCEDHAILEYFSLLDAGESPWIVIGTLNGEGHAWAENNGVVIDFVQGNRIEAIRFNKEIYLKDGKIGNAHDIVKWHGVIERMKYE